MTLDDFLAVDIRKEGRDAAIRYAAAADPADEARLAEVLRRPPDERKGTGAAWLHLCVLLMAWCGEPTMTLVSAKNPYRRLTRSGTGADAWTVVSGLDSIKALVTCETHPGDVSRFDAIDSLLDNEDLEGALAAALDAWRATRDPQLADCIETLGERVRRERGQASLPKKGFHDAWRALADPATMTPGDVDVLVEFFAERHANMLFERVGQVLQLPPDPRFARVLQRLMRTPPWSLTGDQRGLNLIAAAFHHADGRFLAELVGDELAPVRAGLLLRTEGLPEVDASKLVARLGVKAEAAAEDQGEALLAAVHEDPSDPTRRLVYADWLSANDDPRGEFIVLQLKGELSKAEQKREKALLKEHGEQWLGPLASVAMRTKGLVFSGGFPSCVAIKGNSQDVADALVGDPVWSTVEEVAYHGKDIWKPVPQGGLDHPVVRSLKRAWGLTAEHASAVLTAHPDLDGLGIVEIREDRHEALLKQIAESNVRDLSLDDVYDVLAPLYRRLEVVRFERSDDLKRLRKLAPDVPQIVIGYGLGVPGKDHECRLTRVRRGKYEGHLHYAGRERWPQAVLRLMVASFPKNLVPKLTVHLKTEPRGWKELVWHAEQRGTELSRAG